MGDVLYVPPSVAERLKFVCHLCGQRFWEDDIEGFERHCARMHTDDEAQEYAAQAAQEVAPGVFDSADPELADWAKKYAKEIWHGRMRM